MLDDRIIRAARNNAQWCDAVCRAHGNPGEFHEDIWLNRHRVPRFYPNAETLAGPSQRQLELIDELLAARLPSGWAVKDSFCTLDLASRGFRVLFGAEWIYSPVSRAEVIVSSARWEIVRSDLAQAEWETAWGGSAGDTSEEDRFFCRHYSMTKTSRWSPAIAMATSLQGRLQIAATASLDGRTSLRPRPRYSIAP
jgi:hypothetical protein